MKKKQRDLKKQRFTVLEGEGRRFSFGTLKQALVFYVLLLFALVIIVQLGQHWLGDQFLSWRLQVVTAELGQIEKGEIVTGLITRQEKVIAAPAPGMILQLYVQGERVPVGSELAVFGIISRANMEKLRGSDTETEGPDSHLWEHLKTYWQEMLGDGNDNGTGRAEEPDRLFEYHAAHKVADVTFEGIIAVYSDRAGLHSHYIDGWESFSGPVYMSKNDYLENPPQGSYRAEGDLLETGQAITKIVNNWFWFYNIIVPLHPGRTLAEQHNVDLEFDFYPGEAVKGILYNCEIDEENKEVRITYVIERQIDGFEQARWSQASLLYSRVKGIIIPAEALFVYNYRTGVFLNREGRVVFNPVTVIERQDDRVMVEGLEPYSLVITRPELVEEGQRLN